MDDKELVAMQSILGILAELDETERGRVLSWVAERLEIGPATRPAVSKHQTAGSGEHVRASEPEFATFADVFDAAAPRTNSEKALLAGYWLQVCQGAEAFPSNIVNKELQNLGHALVNVTDAFNQLKNKRPALAVQVRKAGKSQQARKLYKITQAGITVANDMINRAVAL